MALESATYLNQLISSNPPAGDPVANAADHIRLIKSVLLATFPNLTAAVTASSAQISLGVCPTGLVTPWYSTVASIPAGWGYCNGSTYPRSDGSGNIVTPNLVDRMIVGSGNLYTQGSLGGSTNHSHNITVAGHALTSSEMPSHAHPLYDPGHGHSVIDPGHAHWINGPSLGYGVSPGGAAAGWTTSNYVTASSGVGGTGIGVVNCGVGGTGISMANSGSGLAHAHGASSDAQSNISPYVAMVWMMKL